MARGLLSPLAPLGSPNQGWSSSGGGTDQGWGSFSLPSSEPSPATLLQMLELAQLRKKKKRSLLGRLFREGVGGLEWTLDKILRPSFAVAEATRAGLEGEGFELGDALHGVREGFMGRKRTGFGQVLEQEGLLKGHRTLRGLAGFGLDVVTDPTLPLFIAAAPVTGGGSIAAYVAAKEAAIGVAKGTLLKSSRIALEGAKTADEAREAARILAKAGPDFKWQRALADARHEERVLIDRAGETVDSYKAFGPAHQDRMAALSAAAQKELEGLGPRKLAVQYKIPFARGSAGRHFQRGRAILETPFKAPSLARTAAGAGIIGKIPPVARGAFLLGKAFKPGFGNEKYHALERVAKRTIEHLEDDYIKAIDNELGPFVRGGNKLTPEEQLDALHVGETTDGIVRVENEGRSRILNEEMLARLVGEGVLSPRQGEFIQAWHRMAEKLREGDVQYGRRYKEELKKGARENVLYVPHLYTKEGQPIKTGKSILSTPGYEQKRLSTRNMSAKLIKELHGDNPGSIITDPVRLLAARARRGAQAQADKLLTDVVASAEGIATHLPDKARIARLSEEMTKREGQLAALKTQSDEGLGDLQNRARLRSESGRQKRLAEAGEAWERKRRNILREINSVSKKAFYDQRRRIPAATKFFRMSGKDFQKFQKAAAKIPQLKEMFARLKEPFSNYKVAETAARKLKQLEPATGARPHGREYKQILENLIANTKPARNARKHQKEVWEDLSRTYLEAKFRRGESWRSRLNAAISNIKKNAISDYHYIAKSEKMVLGKSRYAQRLETLRKQLDRHKAEWAEIHSKVDARSGAHLETQAKGIAQQKRREDFLAARISSRIEKILEEAETAQRGIRNPEAFQPGYTSMSELVAPNGAKLAIPTEMARAMKRMQKALEDDEFLVEFERTWNRLVARWKIWATVVNLGYRVRNTLSDAWNMYISGVPVWAIGRYGEKAGVLMYKALRKGDPEAVKIFREAYDHGILSGLFQGDVEQVMRYFERRAKATDLAKSGHVLQAYQRMMTTFNRNSENWGRLTHYLYRRQYERMGAAEAAAKVREAHFDYEDLTPFERRIKGYAVPFYTWTRKNIPFQIKSMLSSPGRYSAFPKFVNEMEYASGDNEGQIIPDWLKNSLAFNVPFGGKGNLFLPQFGPTDVEKLQHPKQMLGMLTPLLKAPIELAANKSLLTGGPIYGSELAHPRAPISGFAARVLEQIPGTNVGQTARKHGEDIVYGEGANPLVGYAASQIPAFNVLVNQSSNIRRAQRGSTGTAPWQDKSLLSYGMGISTFLPDQEQVIGILEAEQQDAFRQYIRGLRDEQLLPESERTKSKFSKRKRELLKELYGEK